jgi:hypothetical protein
MCMSYSSNQTFKFYEKDKVFGSNHYVDFAQPWI